MLTKAAGERIDALIAKRNTSRRAVSLRAGLNPAYLRDIIDRGREPSAAGLKAICDALATTVDFILTGVEVEPRAKQPTSQAQARQSIRLIGEVGAGMWITANIIHADNVEELEESELPADERYPRAAQYDLAVRGTSLNRIAPDGYRIRCVDIFKAELTPRDGDAVVVRRTKEGGQLVETTVKRLRVIQGRAELHPESSDPRWQEPVEYVDGDTDEVMIVALALYAYRPIRRT